MGRYAIDIERRMAAIKTFDIEADSEAQARVMALGEANSVLWTDHPNTYFEIMSISHVD